MTILPPGVGRKEHLLKFGCEYVILPLFFQTRQSSMDHEDSFRFQLSSIPSIAPSFFMLFFVGWQDLFFWSRADGCLWGRNRSQPKKLKSFEAFALGLEVPASIRSLHGNLSFMMELSKFKKRQWSAAKRGVWPERVIGHVWDFTMQSMHLFLFTMICPIHWRARVNHGTFREQWLIYLQEYYV